MMDAARKGYCLYKMGCKGPTTYKRLLLHTLE
ncbi:hydrogenase-1 small chain [Salmonella enterica subsp. enterica]|uniref:Hydrogenase-1 small chain n=1 Tax=Salmonella enterica I TaxID=59201 RepID=A0A3S4ITD7_SALET|nr:hydrogenase-1 small chain [Salmonella enterica subsp. enterica]